MAVLWNFWLCKGWKHCQKHWRASRETLSKLSRMKRFFETAAKINQCSCFRRFCGIMLEFQQKFLNLIQYMQAKTCSLRWVKFGSSLCTSGSGKEPNTIWTPLLLHDDKNDAERWGGNSTEVYHFVCKPVVSLSCGIAWALVPRAWRLESTGWPAGGQCPGPNLLRSKFIPG